MSKILHLLRNVPDDTVAALISNMNCDDGVTVVCLYPDGITGDAIDWDRLVDDIMAHDQIISWW
jgi:hypothetical protein